MSCFDCGHELDSFNVKEGHNFYLGECHTKTVSGLCPCKKPTRKCSYPKCPDRAIEQYRDQYTPEENPYLCQAHDDLRSFVENCVRGALRKL